MDDEGDRNHEIIVHKSSTVSNRTRNEDNISQDGSEKEGDFEQSGSVWPNLNSSDDDSEQSSIGLQTYDIQVLKKEMMQRFQTRSRKSLNFDEFEKMVRQMKEQRNSMLTSLNQVGDVPTSRSRLISKKSNISFDGLDKLDDGLDKLDIISSNHTMTGSVSSSDTLRHIPSLSELEPTDSQRRKAQMEDVTNIICELEVVYPHQEEVKSTAVSKLKQQVKDDLDCSCSSLTGSFSLLSSDNKDSGHSTFSSMSYTYSDSYNLSESDYESTDTNDAHENRVDGEDSNRCAVNAYHETLTESVLVKELTEVTTSESKPPEGNSAEMEMSSSKESHNNTYESGDSISCTSSSIGSISFNSSEIGDTLQSVSSIPEYERSDEKSEDFQEISNSTNGFTDNFSTEYDGNIKEITARASNSSILSSDGSELIRIDDLPHHLIEAMTKLREQNGDGSTPRTSAILNLEDLPQHIRDVKKILSPRRRPNSDAIYIDAVPQLIQDVVDKMKSDPLSSNIPQLGFTVNDLPGLIKKILEDYEKDEILSYISQESEALKEISTDEEFYGVEKEFAKLNDKQKNARKWKKYYEDDFVDINNLPDGRHELEEIWMNQIRKRHSVTERKKLGRNVDKEGSKSSKSSRKSDARSDQQSNTSLKSQLSSNKNSSSKNKSRSRNHQKLTDKIRLDSKTIPNAGSGSETHSTSTKDKFGWNGHPQSSISDSDKRTMSMRTTVLGSKVCEYNASSSGGSSSSSESSVIDLKSDIISKFKMRRKIPSKRAKLQPYVLASICEELLEEFNKMKSGVASPRLNDLHSNGTLDIKKLHLEFVNDRITGRAADLYSLDKRHQSRKPYSAVKNKYLIRRLQNVKRNLTDFMNTIQVQRKLYRSIENGDDSQWETDSDGTLVNEGDLSANARKSEHVISSSTGPPDKPPVSVTADDRAKRRAEKMRIREMTVTIEDVTDTEDEPFRTGARPSRIYVDSTSESEDESLAPTLGARSPAGNDTNTQDADYDTVDSDCSSQGSYVGSCAGSRAGSCRESCQSCVGSCAGSSQSCVGLCMGSSADAREECMPSDSEDDQQENITRHRQVKEERIEKKTKRFAKLKNKRIRKRRRDVRQGMRIFRQKVLRQPGPYTENIYVHGFMLPTISSRLKCRPYPSSTQIWKMQSKVSLRCVNVRRRVQRRKRTFRRRSDVDGRSPRTRRVGGPSANPDLDTCNTVLDGPMYRVRRFKRPWQCPIFDPNPIFRLEKVGETESSEESERETRHMSQHSENVLLKATRTSPPRIRASRNTQKTRKITKSESNISDYLDHGKTLKTFYSGYRLVKKNSGDKRRPKEPVDWQRQQSNEVRGQEQRSDCAMSQGQRSQCVEEKRGKRSRRRRDAYRGKDTHGEYSEKRNWVGDNNIVA